MKYSMEELSKPASTTLIQHARKKTPMRRRFQNHNLKSEEQVTKALAFIDSYIKENGYSPSVREIAKAMDVPSSSTMAKMVEHMSTEGYLHKPKQFSTNGNRIARTLRLTPKGKKMVKSV